MLKEPTPRDRSDVEPGFDGSGVRVVDGCGRSVSTAILYEAVRAMRELAPEAMIKVRTDVLPAVDSDVRAWCTTTGHELVEVDEVAGVREYVVRKVAEVREQPGWAIVISNPGCPRADPLVLREAGPLAAPVQRLRPPRAR